MKNIQVIDGAENCTYDIFEISEDDFKLIFPNPGQDIEFNTDLFARLSEDETIDISKRLWVKPVEKSNVQGIHGTIFYELDHKKKYYPTKRNSEMKIVL